MRRHSPIAAAVAAGTLGLLATGCGQGATGGGGSRPTVVATTSVLGDVVRQLTGDMADVEVVVPAGADPHELQPSARQAAALREADLVVANGAGLEAGLDDTLDAARDDGATVFEAMDHVDTLDDLAGAGADPHFFTDPARMADAAEALADVLMDAVPALDDEAFRDRADAYVAELRRLDAEVEAVLAAVPPERRTLVTTHDVLGYFADRYGFELVGAIVPSPTTQGAASAGALDELAATIAAEGVPAVFADTSSSTDLVDALADEVGDVAVVDLYSESLGEPGSGADTYAGMVRTNAERIAEALAP
ncbi:MAG: metal ABC transporter solute-binding protein, Zn/Mn family [Acidimicrobiales bacterium]